MADVITVGPDHGHPVVLKNFVSKSFFKFPGDLSIQVTCRFSLVDFVPQSEYYRMTPGHNPLLVNRWIEEDGEIDAGQRDILDANLERKGVSGDAARSFLTREGASGAAQKWRLATSPGNAKNKKWSGWRGFEPLCRENEHSPYWIIRCPATIIKDHGDIWNQRALQTYAALFRVSDVMRRE